MIINEECKIKSEWTLIYTDSETGEILNKKSFFNSMTQAGLAEIMRVGAYGLISVYTVLFNGSTELYRQVKTTVTQSGNVVKYRTLIPSASANASYTGASLFFNATSQTGSGTQLNIATQAFSKTVNQILTIEVKITLS